ncbi:MAG: hypothetical protein AB1Y26_02940 [Cycloclasticus sp.]
MALINCPDCNNQVSTSAVACPQCGAPIAEAKQSKAAGVELTTVQETSKKFKTHIIISAVMFWGGLISIFSKAGNPNRVAEEGLNYPVLFVSLGLVWYVVTKLRVWWHHK